ncbi:MAG: hypothetical protein E7251_13970 [Paenibacillaceae bacterium]|nr:hypothetical protein [Paenibacillaceae bacterium]
MQSGLIGFNFGDTEYSSYFGNSDNDGKMKTGKQTGVYDGDDDTGTLMVIISISTAVAPSI